jgi:hypothetical protein
VRTSSLSSISSAFFAADLPFAAGFAPCFGVAFFGAGFSSSELCACINIFLKAVKSDRQKQDLPPLRSLAAS